MKVVCRLATLSVTPRVNPTIVSYNQGCQILHGTNVKNVPNEHKMYQMVIEYPKSP
jgi:hypothetical protein